MKIGANIAALRRKKGLTQEQLAAQIGVSAPAVSKWETDTSCPDISLLCPLARALNTNVDTLLQFEEQLNDATAVQKIGAVLKNAREEGAVQSEQALWALLRQYPNSAALKFNAALSLDGFRLFFPDSDEDTLTRWNTLQKELLEDVRASDASAYVQTATLQLASMAVTDRDLDTAQALLQELPEHVVDPTTCRARWYLEREEPIEALKTLQKRLFLLVQQAQASLLMMTHPKITPDASSALQIAQAYCGLEQIFHCGSGLEEGTLIEIYLRLHRTADAADCLSRYVDALIGKAVLPASLLFSPGVSFKADRDASLPEMRRMLLRALTEDEQYASLLSYPQAQEAIKKLKASLT